MNAYLAYIKNCTRVYAAYKSWHGDVHIRIFEMTRTRRDWECAAAMYKVQRREEIWRNILDKDYKQSHP